MRERNYQGWAFFLFSALGLLFVGFWNSEFFHFLVEIFGVFMGMLIFIVAVNSRLHLQTKSLLIIGIAYVYVSLFDFMHVITFHGMPFFRYDINQSSHYWLTARGLESMNFFAMFIFYKRQKEINYVKAQIVLLTFSVIIMYLIGQNFLPELYVGTDQTTWGFLIESLVIISFGLSMILVFGSNIKKERRELLVLALGLKIISEATLGYGNHAQLSIELFSHIMKYISYGIIYMVIVSEAIKNPYASVFRIFKSKEEELRYLAEIDQLTGIYNHTKTFSIIEELIRNINKYSGLAIMLIDVDDFKEVNDTYGHLKGDEILKSFAMMLKGCEVPGKIVGRYGGDEFAVALPNISKDDLSSIFERMRLKQQELIDELDIEFTYSAGVAFYEKGDHTKDLIYKADIKMYESKRNGKNQFTVW